MPSSDSSVREGFRLAADPLAFPGPIPSPIRCPIPSRLAALPDPLIPMVPPIRMVRRFCAVGGGVHVLPEGGFRVEGFCHASHGE